jgi:hypothetical protein
MAVARPGPWIFDRGHRRPRWIEEVPQLDMKKNYISIHSKPGAKPCV